MKNKYIQVFVSCASREEAKKIVDSLLLSQIIACGQIFPQMESFYLWRGQIEAAREVMLVLKSELRHYKAIEEMIKSLHEYEVPEIIAVPVLEGSAEYLSWIKNEIK